MSYRSLFAKAPALLCGVDLRPPIRAIALQKKINGKISIVFWAFIDELSTLPAKLPANANIAIALPDRQILTHTLCFDRTLTPNDIYCLLTQQSQKFLGDFSGALAVDFRCVQDKTIVVATPQTYLQPAHALQAKIIDIESYAISRYIQQTSATLPEHFAIVWLENHALTFFIVQHGFTIFTHDGFFDTDFTLILKRAWQLGMHNRDITLSACFVAGGHDALSNTVQTIQSLLSLPVVLLDPFEKNHEKGPAFVIAAGLALREIDYA